jgi:hypothetical protein
MFYVLLSLDGVTNIVESFVIYQQLEPVTLGEAINQAFAMLVSAPRHVCGDAGVKHTIAPVRHHVDESGHGVIEQGIEGSFKPFEGSCGEACRG